MSNNNTNRYHIPIHPLSEAERKREIADIKQELEDLHAYCKNLCKKYDINPAKQELAQQPQLRPQESKDYTEQIRQSKDLQRISRLNQYARENEHKWAKK